MQIAVESFFRSQELQTFSRTLSAELVKDAGRVVKAIRYQSLSVRFILSGKSLSRGKIFFFTVEQPACECLF